MSRSILRQFAYLFFLFISSMLHAQSTNGWGWAKRAGGSLGDGIKATIVDSENNSYSCGLFVSDSITFDDIKLVNSLKIGGSSDLFLVKYNSKGKALWAKNASSHEPDKATAIAKDETDHVYLAGIYEGSAITFGSFTLTNLNSTSDGFIVKYDKDGNVIWAQNFPDLSILSIAVDNTGSLLVTGTFGVPSVTLGSILLENKGIINLFILKLDVAGNVSWAHSEGGNSLDISNSIACDKNGNVFICGSFTSKILTIGATALSNSGLNDIFFAKYDSKGNPILAISAGGNKEDVAKFLTMDKHGNFYITGNFASPAIHFGSATLTNANDDSDIFIIKFDTKGNPIWSKSAEGAGSSNYGEGESMAVDSSENIFVTGFFTSDLISFDSIKLSNSGNANLFVVKYDKNGNVKWGTTTASDNSFNSAFSVAVDQWNNIYLGGSFFSRSISFGQILLTNADSIITADIFLAKFGDVTTSIPDSRKVNVLSIYPNPGNGIFYIKPTDLQITQIRVYDGMRRLVYESKKQFQEINLASQKDGIYFMEILTQDHQIFNSRLIITD